MKFQKCSNGKGCDWCKDKTPDKASWFSNYLGKIKGTTLYGTKPLVPCIKTAYSLPNSSEKLAKANAMQAWRQYKNRKINATKVQTNYTLTKETIKILRQSATQEGRPLNLELEIIINTYLKMKAEGKLDHEISLIVLNKLIPLQNIN
ncbi:hypothetical protein [Pseudoalteromonas sp. JB197]|uniref:hypothetical protein n=1 Tax=Pseudoalteromonas sp. JB197 TaxID=1434839 RepID=UPI000BB7464B|nr:hypothetical protein [Pseudoalteromonas sp. JB197]PCC14253.1 hypothetical protein CIK86_13950 [Pseudoalteromonas sp. JB197]